jgi:hypothetical protein
MDINGAWAFNVPSFQNLVKWEITPKQSTGGLSVYQFQVNIT